MSKQAEKQLLKVSVASLANYDADTQTYFIPKKTNLSISIGRYYIINIDRSLLDPKSNDVLYRNWNHGTVPKCDRMRVEVDRKLGTMIHVVSVAEDETKAMWEGWLPENMVSVEKEL